MLRTIVTSTPITTRVAGEPLSEVLAGEPFEVLELARGHAWGVSPVDGSVGFVASDALGPFIEATHIVSCPSAGALPLGTRLACDQTNASPLGVTLPDFVTVAETLATGRVPAVAGGRSGAGVDPAGLVFLCLSLAGVPAPRFVDLQAAQLGHLVADSAPVLRGDLVFFGDGVGIATGADTLVHVGADHVEIIGLDALGEVALRRRLP